MPLLQEKAVRAVMRERARENGRRLQQRRRQLGLTQTELAKLAGVTQRAISHYELGVRVPDDTGRVILASALACDIAAIWTPIDRVEIAVLVRDVAKGDAA